MKSMILVLGLDWLMRKIICMTPVTYVFKKSEEPGRYVAEVLTSRSKTIYSDWALDETFEGDGMDDTRHKVRHGTIVNVYF